jgi:hypothetical protein
MQRLLGSIGESRDGMDDFVSVMAGTAPVRELFAGAAP